jgi:hypothetical protein
VDRAPEKQNDGMALVTSDVKAGSIVLSGKKGSFTLAWSAKDESRVRAIPAGDYRIRTARLHASKEKSTWVYSSCSPRTKPKTCAAGKTTRLTIGETVHLKARARIVKGRLRVGFGLLNDAGWGASVFRDGKRITIGCELYDKAGKRLTTATMKYG